MNLYIYSHVVKGYAKAKFTIFPVKLLQIISV